ncbi:hypothetical protein AAFC00_004725 [Neodothiora populina]|uniref:Delta(14)-sterol reductase n=1 Tax=Neodothiora populina TaxID=2781224 RepID=A0ABR3P302_9PEZI
MSPSSREKHGYEFGGPIGASLISFGLPIGCYAFAFLCNDVSGAPPPSLLHPSTLSLDKLIAETGWPGFSGLCSVRAILGTLAYYAFSLVLNVVLPAREVEGVELQNDQGRHKYNFNAFSSAVFTLTIAAAGTALQGPKFPLWPFIHENYIGILTANILISYALATYVYVASFSVKANDPNKRQLAAGGVTGNIIYDWFIGRELNPRISIPLCGEVDIKAWMELRPGMLGWILLNLAFIMGQYGTYGYITDSILIVTFTQAFYVLDALWNEPAILTTMDITTDGFGFMLAFGDLVWVPFIYSIQGRYLSIHPVKLGTARSVFIMAVYFAGYYIFRASNSEKNRFRTNPNDPSVSHLKYIETKRGTRLLISGWWGTARHINYFGDWLMSWAYCLPTWMAGYAIRSSILTGEKVVSQGPNNEMAGAAIPITYFYMLYFAILLVHRENRDSANCARKYGKSWDEYCRIVKWKIVPGIY